MLFVGVRDHESLGSSERDVGVAVVKVPMVAIAMNNMRVKIAIALLSFRPYLVKFPLHEQVICKHKEIRLTVLEKKQRIKTKS